MQLFIGGACAGKRDVVKARFPAAGWHRIEARPGLNAWQDRVVAGMDLVLTGWLDWLDAALDVEPADDTLRSTMTEALDDLCHAEREQGFQVVLILPEIGRGIVPMDARDRRLRDLAGWLAQDAAVRARQVWYVRHGLVQSLREINTPVDGH
ncbi:bifunctional adenosylcobinamide kinase/adenosylcobinamide-phosphate guanylyltransferase [Billgrantia endophytica]|uniref:Adenosylcobinamide kinase n=1 Tax=Billgrantia endophytica TaxID=2033802 RepID=A0A2N7UED6_9GAMM|nr:bifunctional adenosylcobinamide kinase/adenosylcobinamide-phosphate guanylyltransferase [Halomonas endophytica]PMR78745.1 adenosylcobinamide kinase [Halomonas endophytica]